MKKRLCAGTVSICVPALSISGIERESIMPITVGMFFLVAALILFIIEAWHSKSLVAAGLACLTVAILFGSIKL